MDDFLNFFFFCLRSLKLLQLAHALYPSHCWADSKYLLTPPTSTDRVHRHADCPWSVCAACKTKMDRTAGNRGPGRGILQSKLVFLTKAQWPAVSAHSQEHQCSFFQTSINITPTAHITKAEFSFTCQKTYVHADPSPALEAWMGFHWGYQASWSVWNSLISCLVSCPIKYLS